MSKYLTTLAAVGGVATILYGAWRLRNVRFVSRESERAAAAVKATLEVGDLGEDEDLPVRARRRTVTATARAVASAKATFGVIEEPTRADKMCVERHIRDFLRNKGTHDVDIAAVAPVAAAMYWVKTVYEVAASQLGNTATVAQSNAEYNRRYISATWWFGRFLPQ
jgi:hypothetical protein